MRNEIAAAGAHGVDFWAVEVFGGVTPSGEGVLQGGVSLRGSASAYLRCAPTKPTLQAVRAPVLPVSE